MGQFQSREYDGDPYVELMRGVPERELIWWIQKVVWLVEGATFLEHFGRTYPDMLLWRCHMCNGAGCLTCPHCGGRKDPALAARAQLGSLSCAKAAAAAAAAGTLTSRGRRECDHCGPYCDWDDESEWEDRWATWESKLAYYDRAYGELLDEWYEDVLHEGNLEEDTPHEEPEVPPGTEDSDVATWKEAKRMPKRMAALMARYGGHPYEKGDLLRFNIVDPQKSLRDNMVSMGYHEHDLPPELHPVAFPELLITPFSPLQQFDKEIQAEYLLMTNLDAAVRNKPKPIMLQPTAGTVPCPGCLGAPYSYTLVPNIAEIFKCEPPWWQGVLARSAALAAHPGAVLEGRTAGSSSSSSGVRHYLEYPQVAPEQDQAVAELAPSIAATAPAVAARGGVGRALAQGAARSAALDSEGDLGEQQQQQGGRQLTLQPRGRLRQEPHHLTDPTFWQDTGSRTLASSSGRDGLGSGAVGDVVMLRGQPARSHPVLGDRDPLSDDWAKAVETDELVQAAWDRSPLDGRSRLERDWALKSAAPAKQAAQQQRDAELLKLAPDADTRDELIEYLQRRRPAAVEAVAGSGDGDGSPGSADVTGR